jgi:hypothetical protein
MPSQFNLPDAVRGVFAYLDAALPKEVREDLSGGYLYRDDKSFHEWGSTPRKVGELITDEFRLMHWGAPIRKALDAYRLYHKTDMANALTCAYSLHLRGMDPGEALNADYCLEWCGILAWTTLEAVKQAYGSNTDYWLWHQFSPFHREGDRFVKYRTPPSMGTLLVRGDRLVWRVEELHTLPAGVSLRFQAEDKKFKELGGNRAFLAGEFDWPPADWINPVTDEEEAASLGKTKSARACFKIVQIEQLV